MSHRIIVPHSATITITTPKDHDAIKAALRDLLRFQHPGDRRIFNKRNCMWEKGDEDAEFFTEAYLYTLFEDKDAARTLLGLIGRVIDTLGYSEQEVRR